MRSEYTQNTVQPEEDVVLVHFEVLVQELDHLHHAVAVLPVLVVLLSEGQVLHELLLLL